MAIPLLDRAVPLGFDFGAGLPGRHVPRAPLNTEFNSILQTALKMRLAPKLTPFYLNLGVLRELGV